MRGSIRSGRMRNSKSLRDERGAVMVFVALALVVLLGMAALAIDLGQAHMAKQRLHDVCDAAALAAAWAIEFAGGEGDMQALALQAATEIFEANNPELAPPTVAIATTAEGTTVTVSGSMTVDFLFASVLNPDLASGTITASSRALLEAIPKLKYQFVPLALSDWQIQPFRVENNGEPPDHLRTPYWIQGTDEFGFANQPNLIPITFGNSSYVPETYADMLRGDDPAFQLVTGSGVRLIEKNIVDATCDALTARIQGDARTWGWWETASNLEKATSDRIVVLPVVDSQDITRIRQQIEAGVEVDYELTLVGFAGFLITGVNTGSAPGADGRMQQWTNVYGYFVPGTVGRKSIRWMEQFENYTQTNIMYRVRLIR